MKRKIYDKLVEWKNERAGKTALLIDGARRVGKSFIAEEFAKKNYKSYILIDFNNVGNEVKNLFENKINDLNTFYLICYHIFFFLVLYVFLHGLLVVPHRINII